MIEHPNTTAGQLFNLTGCMFLCHKIKRTEAASNYHYPLVQRAQHLYSQLGYPLTVGKHTISLLKLRISFKISFKVFVAKIKE